MSQPTLASNPLSGNPAPNQGVVQVALLSLCNALAFCATPMIMLIGSLIGTELAPAGLATLPIAAMVIGAALGITPVTALMQRFGRKTGFLSFMLLGVMACLLAGIALKHAHFTLFCFSIGLIGISNSAMQQFRFAAMECVAPARAPTAASAVLSGGIVAAIAGPELALLGRNFTPVEYQGAFWLAALCYGAAMLALCFWRPGAKVSADITEQAPRPVRELLQNRAFVLAVTSAAAGFAAMSFIMTATPISMHHLCGHSLADTKWVIQSHIAAMFLPSLLTPWLVRWFRIRGLILLGCVSYLLTIVIGLFDTSVAGFWLQLVMLGIGWNFFFVGGTALLPQTYRPSERFKAQRFNDTLVFSAQAIASLSAGWALNHSSWAGVLLISVVSIVLILVALARSPRPSAD